MSEKSINNKRVIVDISGRIWGISVVPKEYPLLLGSDGLTNCRNREIYLSDDLSREKLKKVLFEEYSFAFFYELRSHSTFLIKLNQKSNKKIVDEILKKLYPEDNLKLQRYRMNGRERE